MAVDVGPIADFVEGTIRIVSVKGREIGIAHARGGLYALRNVCPHQSGPLCRGKLAHQLGASEPGSIHFAADRLVVTCPWHGWEFDVATGKALYDDSMRVATYPVEIVGGRVLITLKGRDVRDESTEKLAG